MALVLGTNCGFVTVAPTGDPVVSADVIDTFAWAIKDTSPATAVKVVEIGWYCDNSTQESLTEVGIYAHDAGDNEPGVLVGKAAFVKGTGAGWKKATVDIIISPNTIYWLAYQLDNTTPNTNMNYGVGTARMCRQFPLTELPNPWGNSNNNYDNYNAAVYAVWETGGVAPTGVFKGPLFGPFAEPIG